MKEDKNIITVYNFISKLFNWNEVQLMEEIKIQSRIPKKIYEAYLIEDHKFIGSVYAVMGYAYWVKLDDSGEVKELYFKEDPRYPDYNGISVDINTLEIKELYKKNETTVKKYDVKTKKLLQTNYLISEFSELPKEYKEKLKDFEHKDKIFFYANKPYGKIVEISV